MESFNEGTYYVKNIAYYFCNIPKHDHYTHDFPFDLRCESDNYTTMYTFTICRCVGKLKDESVQ